MRHFPQLTRMVLGSLWQEMGGAVQFEVCGSGLTSLLEGH